ncbi:hypothetical protein Taro_029493, partial [Colocasia esculenta]|nr:hypothetical protein [Colocasia esculenta]
MVVSWRVQFDKGQPIIPRDRHIPTISTSNRFSVLRWFRGKQEDSKVEAGIKQKTWRPTKVKQMYPRRSDAKCTSLQHVEPKHLNGEKRKREYRKSNYTPVECGRFIFPI